MGCVATPSENLVKVAIVLTAPADTHPQNKHSPHTARKAAEALLHHLLLVALPSSQQVPAQNLLNCPSTLPTSLLFPVACPVAAQQITKNLGLKPCPSGRL